MMRFFYQESITSIMEVRKMSDFKEKCGNALIGGTTGAAVGGSIGAAIGALGGPVTSALGAKIGGAIGSLAGLFFD